MKDKLSTAHLVTAASVCAVALLGFCLLILSADPNVEHPVALAVLAFAMLGILHLAVKRFPPMVEVDQPHAGDRYEAKNPLLLLSILLVCPAVTSHVFTLSAPFSIEEDLASGRVRMVQLDEPTSYAKLLDLALLLAFLSCCAAVFWLAIREDATPMWEATVFAVLGVGVVLQWPLKRWCLSKVSRETSGVLVSPLLLAEGGVLGTVARDGRRALVSPRVLGLDERVKSYVIAHEQGHIRFGHLGRRRLHEASVLACFLVYCSLLAVREPFAPLALVPVLAALLWGMRFVAESESRADEHAAELLGPEACLWALRWLRARRGLGGGRSAEGSSLFETLLYHFNLYRGRVPIEERIRHIEHIYGREGRADGIFR